MNQQNQTFDRQNGVVTIYACGGTGINIANKLMRNLRAGDDRFASVRFVFVDTSTANLAPDHDPASVYLIPGVSGSGKTREANAEKIVKHVPDIMTKFQPSDMNIFLSSLGGGSGSVIAPSLMSYARERDISALAMAVGTNDSIIDIKNTYRTLKTYAGIPLRLKKSAVVCLHENRSANQMDQDRVDTDVMMDLSVLLALYSRQHQRLDDKDLYNWLNFEIPTKLTPSLATLNFVNDQSHMTNVGAMRSVVSLAGQDVDSTLYGRTSPWHVTGISQHHADRCTHHIISVGYLEKRIAELEKQYTDLDAAEQVAVMTEAVSASDLDSNGLVL